MAKALIILLLSLQGTLFIKIISLPSLRGEGSGVGLFLFIRHINALPDDVHVKSASHGKPY